MITGANINDLTMLAELLDGRVTPISEQAAAEGLHLCLDKAYDYKPGHQAAQERLFTLHIPRVLTEEQPEGTVQHPARRWVVEVCHSWMNRFPSFAGRWEKTFRNHLGFAQLAILTDHLPEAASTHSTFRIGSQGKPRSERGQTCSDHPCFFGQPPLGLPSDVCPLNE